MPQMIPSKKFIATEKKPPQYFAEQIPIAFEEACNNFGFDPNNMTQSNFNACLMYVSENVMQKCNLKTADDNNVYTRSDYDIALLDYISNIYIGLCYRYNKLISIYGFCLLCNIQQNLLYMWENQIVKASTPTALQFVKKLEAAAEESKRAMLTDKGRNPVGILALLNHDNGYNLPGVSREVAKPQLSAQEIRDKFALLSDNKANSGDSIPDTIPDNS